MESSSTSICRSNTTGGGVEIQGRTCRCGSKVRMFTSRTQQNPGRRFLRCPGVCWVDQYGCDHGAAIVPGLIVRLNQLECQYRMVETEMNRLETENRRLLESFVNLQAANNALLYKFKLVLICVIFCLLAFVWFM
ncbi:hypothetical protein ACJIZ3_005839 [Penstemon smallii]|uniref:Zinc finger GRF-type domain-containing protein n=1 Tax=Penstemon smallii TaxID=265156 RepID=A0ABD3S606_9LAMI